MPGSVTSTESLGQPSIPADADFSPIVVGRTTLNPLGAGPGPVSPQYSSAAALAAAWGLGDAVDCACQGIVTTNGNPNPPPVAIYQTPATTDGARGSSLDTSDVTGTAVITKTASTHPVGTYQPRGRVAVGGTIGTAGIYLEFSPDDGRTWLPRVALGTANTKKMQIGGADTGVQYDFKLEPIEGSTDVTSAGLYGAGTLTTKTLILDTGAGPATLTWNGGTNAANQAAMLAAIEATWPSIDASVSSTHLVLTLTTGGSIVVGAGTSNNVLGLTAGTYAATLVAGDEWAESLTTPPMWAAADLYAAGPPATGALAAIAESNTHFPVIVISEPVASGDWSTLVAGLNYLRSQGKKALLLVRFRDPTDGETDAQYITAFQAFAAACTDDRIGIVAGHGWLTDAFRGYRYFRSGLPAVFARMQSCAAVGGKLGERIAQHPGYVARGPLEGFTIVDDNGDPIDQAHDEGLAGGIDGPIGGAGGGITFYYQRRPELRGTYVSDAPVLYPALSRVLTIMDRRVLNGIELIAESIAWTEIQGADIYDPITFELVQDLVDGMQTKIATAIRQRYASEFQNAADPNLVVIDPTVTVSGARVSISGTVNVRLYGYTWSVALTFSATR